MKKRMLAGLTGLVICLAAAVPALAANVFVFREKTITVHEGETAAAELRREGVFEGDGEVEFVSSRPEVAEISDDGIITAGKAGQATVTAALMRGGKRVGKAQTLVKVVRPVTKVTLSTEGLAVFDPEDPKIFSLLNEESDYRVLAVAAGASINLNAVCTPEDATNRAVTFTTSDAGVARVVNGKVLRGVQRGECDLTVASAQDPDITETFRVLVTQPVRTIQIESPDKKTAAGSGLQLKAVCLPEDASIKEVVWISRNPQVATVDANGYVTGIKKGTATITASAADGSRAAGNFAVMVTQPVTSITFTQDEIPVIVGRSAQARVTVLPADATDKTVEWSTSDETIATVRNGRISGLKAGICSLICTSKSDPDVVAEAKLIVSQQVTKIECTNTKEELTLLTGQSVQTNWDVQPEDATIKTLSFRTPHTKMLSVDENGVVTAKARGIGTVIATSQDGAKRQGTVKVTVIQPVTGVSMQHSLYYVQRGWRRTIRAVVEPRNANNQKVYWSSEDEGIATVKSNGTSTGSVRGERNGTTTISAFTEDGGFIATTRVRVGNFNAAVMIEDLTVNKNNEIKIVLRNMSDDITFENIHYKIECFDRHGEPMICNKDGESTYFEGNYPYEVAPRDRTVHGCFRFKNYVIEEKLGAVILTVTSWRDTNGVTWSIPEGEQVPRQWTRLTPKKK